jgi:hypothetical protein
LIKTMVNAGTGIADVPREAGTGFPLLQAYYAIVLRLQGERLICLNLIRDISDSIACIGLLLES